MATLSQVIDIQKKEHVLWTPASPKPATSPVPEDTPLTFGIYNEFSSSSVYAYVTGIATSQNNSLFILQSDGRTPYYPSNPSSAQSPLQESCTIALGGFGSTTSVTVPYLSGARVWLCVGNPLTFLLNPGNNGPGLVEPSISNTSDPNYQFTWDFCEFTYNSEELYANISYVDFVCLPISLALTSTNGSTMAVGGTPSDGLATICNNLIAQNNQDGAGWDKLIITHNGTPLRVLSPTNGIILNPGLFSDYWTDYLNQVWGKYISTPLTIDTQTAEWGVVTGHTSNDGTTLNFDGIGSFTKPSAVDIFGANSGPFAPPVGASGDTVAEMLNIGARIDAGINRSTLLTDSNQPDGEIVSTYYTNGVTNHYAKIVHQVNVDGLGYCFPYDDVNPSGAVDQGGHVNSSSPADFVITVGTPNSISKRRIATPQKTPVLMKRGLDCLKDVEEPVVVENSEVDPEADLEKGDRKLLNEFTRPSMKRQNKIYKAMEQLFGKHLAKFHDSPFYQNRLRPIVEILSQFTISVLSISMRAVLSRVFIVAFFLIFYFLGLLPHGHPSVEIQRQILNSPAAPGSPSIPQLL